MNLEFSREISKNAQISDSMKTLPVGTEMSHADRRTDGKTDGHEEANILFSQFWIRA